MTSERKLAIFAIAAATIAVLLLATTAGDAATSRVDRLTLKQLHREARTVARNGGITCHTVGVGAGCATPYMRRLTRELVKRRFAHAGPEATRWALCITGRESGFNPAAISATNDHGAGQLNKPSHPWVNTTRIAWSTTSSPTGWASDPVYSVAVFHRLARGGTNRSPWNGGAYPC